jgi:aerobic-type carbon monoxide dehydrogenase small subunit (CoxS/CutS family)
LSRGGPNPAGYQAGAVAPPPRLAAGRASGKPGGRCYVARVEVSINGRRYDVDASGARTLAEAIRDDAELTGTKVACGEGTCGSCTVVVDGRAVLSCLTLAAACDGASILTVEADRPALARLREAFIAEDAFQCGFCTPGQVVTAWAVLRDEAGRPADGRRERVAHAMSGVLCRCTGYQAIIAAICRLVSP